jgi:plasmid stability protein
MGDILIRNVDDAVIAAWKKRAAKNGRSLQAELVAELNEAVKAQRKTELIESLRRLRATVDMSKLDKEGWEMIREDRDSR